jgi:hypothetical protein
MLLRFERFDAFLQVGEGAGDVGVLLVRFEVEGYGALSFEEGELEVVGEEEELAGGGC